MGIKKRSVLDLAVACVREWKVAPVVLSHPQCIVALSFTGQCASCNRANRDIAYCAAALSRREHVPIIAQCEVTECLAHTTTAHHSIGPPYRGTLRGPNTHEVVRAAAEYMAARAWTRVIAVAHPHHIWRVVHVLRSFGFTVGVPDRSRIQYDPASLYWWSRGAPVFIAREIGARFYFLLRGWLA